MFFKGRSKSLWIYSPEIMMLSIDMDDRNLLSIQLFKFWVGVDVNNLNLEI
jgi:hypothetical protein